jgi:L-alanine-DL-glutamate epimerase-like enolase superfamily enzyme
MPMRIAKLEFIPVSIPYKRRQISTQIQRDGTTDVIVKAVADDGLVGWGESCSGANVQSVIEALKGMVPFVLGRSPWDSEAIRTELWWRGLWQFRKPTASFAYAGIDMALWDLCGKATGEPLYRLFGGKVRERVSYHYSVLRGSAEDVATQCQAGLAKGYRHFYMKIGLNIEDDLKMVEAMRATIGPEAKIRLDVNAAWKVNEAIRNIARLDAHRIDFIEQPVTPDPVSAMQEVRRGTSVALSANEGLWTVEDTYQRIKARVADVYCFSPYWVGSLAQFQRLCHTAHFEALQVSKHTHGEFGITATACQHILLTLHNVIEGNQQSALASVDDILKTPVPLMNGPEWGVPEGAGLCLEVDEEKLGRYHEVFRQQGQILSYDPALIGTPLEYS